MPPATVRVLNWNIQNFGKKKAALGDVVGAIAQVVVASRADIFVMLEVNTTDGGTAKGLAATMLAALDARSPAGQFKTCVLSPNTGLEFYAYFVRDTAVTSPVVLTGTTGPALVTTIGGPPNLDISKAVFTMKTDAGVLADPFPLLTPDLPSVTGRGRVLPVPRWLNSQNKPWRSPVLGLFALPGASVANEVLPVVACHFDPAPQTAGQQVRVLKSFNVLAGPAGANPAPGSPIFPNPVQLNIKPAPASAAMQKQTPNWLFVGDFNIDALKASQRRYYQGLLALNARDWLQSNSLMMTPATFTGTRPGGTQALANKAVDDMFTFGPGVSVPPAKPTTVTDLAGLVKAKTIKLKESVDHYEVLDQRGFKDHKKSYRKFVSDFADQLSGDPSNTVTLSASLLGARLISDHLPVLLEVTVA